MRDDGTRCCAKHRKALVVGLAKGLYSISLEKDVIEVRTGDLKAVVDTS
jgi:hypothetical protein